MGFLFLCYSSNGTSKEEISTLIEIDFDSRDAIYIQIQNQIIKGIAMDELHEGDPLPSVRQLAELAGVNMHTVNKAYAMLRQDGFIRMERRGAVIAIDINKARALLELKQELLLLLAKSSCRNISREEVHELVDEIYEEYGRG